VFCSARCKHFHGGQELLDEEQGNEIVFVAVKCDICGKKHDAVLEVKDKARALKNDTFLCSRQCSKEFEKKRREMT